MRAPAKPKNAKGTFRRLVSYLAPHKGKLIAVAACIVFSTAASATGTMSVMFGVSLAKTGRLVPLFVALVNLSTSSSD